MPELEKPRLIVHLDLDAFFCAVEEHLDPSLAGIAFAVGARADERGVIATCSYAARRFGVRSAMPTSHAMRLCPHLRLLPGRHGVYGDFSRLVMARLRAVTPLLEQISIDEAFLDLTETAAEWSDGEAIARKLQTEIRETVGLPCSLGIATSKLVAKIATEQGKAIAKRTGRWDMPPCGLVAVLPGSEAAFLAPLDVGDMWGVGPKMAERLRGMGIGTLGDLAAYDSLELARRFGKWGVDLARRAKGIDNRGIVTYREAKSVSRETTFARDISDRVVLANTLRELSESVSERLARKAFAGRVVKLKVRWPDFSVTTRQFSLSVRTLSSAVIADAALVMLDAIRAVDQPVRLVGVGMSQLQSLHLDGDAMDSNGQMRLFVDGDGFD